MIVDQHGTIHRPAGTPAGGQFAGHVRTAPSGTLTTPADPALTPAEVEEAASTAVEALLWSSGRLDDWEEQHGTRPVVLAASSRVWLRDQISTFADENADLIAQARAAGFGGRDEGGFAGAFGHDIVLTRNREGTGFWDRDELAAGDLGQRLTDACEDAGPLPEVFVNDAGEVEFDVAADAEAAVQLRQVAREVYPEAAQLVFTMNYTDEGYYLALSGWVDAGGSLVAVDYESPAAVKVDDVVFRRSGAGFTGSQIPGFTKTGPDEWRFPVTD